MIPQSPGEVWLIILALAAGTFAIRFSFLGLIGKRDLPEWVLRHLRYTPVAVIPGLVAPLVIWPAATGGTFDLPRVLAAVVTISVGYYSRNVVYAIIAGALALYLSLTVGTGR